MRNTSLITAGEIYDSDIIAIVLKTRYAELPLEKDLCIRGIIYISRINADDDVFFITTDDECYRASQRSFGNFDTFNTLKYMEMANKRLYINFQKMHDLLWLNVYKTFFADREVRRGFIDYKDAMECF